MFVNSLFSIKLEMAGGGVKPLFLDADQVERNLPLQKLIDGVEQSFVKYSTKQEGVFQPQRLFIPIADYGHFLIKPAVSIPDGTLATKLLTLYPGNEEKHGIPSHQAIVTIFDSKTGALRGVLDGIAITDLRTAAATAVAVKYLSKSSDNILAIIGTGHQAVSHMKVLPKVRNFREIRVYGGLKERRESFAKTWGAIACDSVEEAVKDADIIVTVRKSATEPVLFHDWVKPCSLINILGAVLPHQRDVDDAIMKTSQIFADSSESASKSAGDVVQTKVTISAELGKVINGEALVDWSRTRVFKSDGLALQDLVAGKIVLDNFMATNC